jgi:hypothetical protein
LNEPLAQRDGADNPPILEGLQASVPQISAATTSIAIALVNACRTLHVRRHLPRFAKMEPAQSQLPVVLELLD